MLVPLAARGAADELTVADLETLEAITAAVAQANGLPYDDAERYVWRAAIQEAYRTMPRAQRDIVAAVCRRLRDVFGEEVMSTRSTVTATRAALREGVALRTPAEREFEARELAAFVSLGGAESLDEWLSDRRAAIGRRIEELRSEIGDDPTTIDQATGEMLYRDQIVTTPSAPNLEVLTRQGEPEALTRAATGATLAFATRILVEDPRALLRI